jgi:hypothetical protein
MKKRTAVIIAAGFAALGGAALIACFDLFHSTSDVLTACQIDAGLEGCSPDAAIADAGQDVVQETDGDATDFCARSFDPLANARHACAWLGACETPLGRNAFGACMFQALLAYDCAANPNHHVQGTVHALWDCLWQVHTCDAVDRCVFPDGRGTCADPGVFTSCGDGGANRDVRAACLEDGGRPPSNGAYGENCALWGQTCTYDAGSAHCTGSGGIGCTGGSCQGNRRRLQWCPEGIDIGMDCAGNGAQSCDGFPDADAPLWVACQPSDAGGACAPDASASCVNGVAVSCPTGALESIACGTLLGSDAACNPGPLSPPFDWTAACVTTPAQCTADTCTSDGGLAGCVRGATIEVDCAKEKLGVCRTVQTGMGSAGLPACGPP